MDYMNQSVSSLLRGPLIHTVQGRVLIGATLGYASLAALLWAHVFSTVPETQLNSLAWGCLIYPGILFLMFVKHSAPAFKSSWGTALYLMVLSVLPLAWYAWGRSTH